MNIIDITRTHSKITDSMDITVIKDVMVVTGIMEITNSSASWNRHN